MTLEHFLMAKSKQEIIDIMHGALDLMQQFNGRTPTYCIVIAAGGEATEHEDGTMTHSVPKSSDTHVEVVNKELKDNKMSDNIYTHRRVKDATYRVRKMRGKDLYSVTEYYKGERVQLVEDNLVPHLAHKLAYDLADRDDF